MDSDEAILPHKLNLAFRALEFSLLETLSLEWDEALEICNLRATAGDTLVFLNSLETLWFARLKLEKDGLPQETAHWRLFGECLLLEHDPHLSAEVPLQERRHARQLFGALALSQLGFAPVQISALIEYKQVTVAWTAILAEASSTEAIGQAVDSLRVKLNLHRPYDFARPEADPVGDQLFQKFLFYRRLQDELDIGGFSAAVERVLGELENDEIRAALTHLSTEGERLPQTRVSGSEKTLWNMARTSTGEVGQIVDVLAQIARLQFRRHETKVYALKYKSIIPKLSVISK